jgi:hypothetical protein
MPNICFEPELPPSMISARLRVYYLIFCNLVGGITLVPRIDNEMDKHERSMIALKRFEVVHSLAADNFNRLDYQLAT